jgi:hypothetical protein
MATTVPAQTDVERRDAFAEQLFRHTIGALELMHVYVGERLGLYDALADGAAMSPSELADRTVMG